MYLLTAIKLSPDTRKWLNSYAIKLSRDTWLHNSTCPGTEAAVIDSKIARQMAKGAYFSTLYLGLTGSIAW